MTFEERFRAEAEERDRQARAAEQRRQDLYDELVADVDGPATDAAQRRLDDFTADAVAKLRDLRVPPTFARSYTRIGPVRERKPSLFSRDRSGWWVSPFSGLILLTDEPCMHRVHRQDPPMQAFVTGVLTRLPRTHEEMEVVGAGLWLVGDDDFVAAAWESDRDGSRWRYDRDLEQTIARLAFT